MSMMLRTASGAARGEGEPRREDARALWGTGRQLTGTTSPTVGSSSGGPIGPSRRRRRCLAAVTWAVSTVDRRSAIARPLRRLVAGVGLGGGLGVVRGRTRLHVCHQLVELAGGVDHPAGELAGDLQITVAVVAGDLRRGGHSPRGAVQGEGGDTELPGRGRYPTDPLLGEPDRG